MQDRNQLIDAFLRGTSWEKAERQPLQQDASFRRYFRLKKHNDSAILMDAPPPERPVGDFARIAEHLLHLGLRAPRPLKVHNHDGLMLIEDLGTITFTHALNDGEHESKLYTLAVNDLIKLHQHPEATQVDVPSYDSITLNTEAELLCDWFYPYALKKPISDVAKAAYFCAWNDLNKNLDSHNKALVLRDYHVDNLMLVPNKNGELSCGQLDFQDALIGSPAYDLVSLLEDARRDIPNSLTMKMLDLYFSQPNPPDRQLFMRDYTTLGVQRHCKVAGIFVRLSERDQKPHYLKHLPRVIKYLQNSLNAPHMHALKSWFDTYLPLS